MHLVHLINLIMYLRIFQVAIFRPQVLDSALPSACKNTCIGGEQGRVHASGAPN
jgi:hypothetical protein